MTAIRKNRVTSLVSLLEVHAETSAAQSSTNNQYADRVRRNAVLLQELLSGNRDELQGVVSTWFTDFKPIAEIVFGEPIDSNSSMELHHLYGDYVDTTIAGIQGRVGKISLDEVMGPMLTLDLRTK